MGCRSWSATRSVNLHRSQALTRLLMLAGMLDWDDTSIVFTKRSLIEFLKSVKLIYKRDFGS